MSLVERRYLLVNFLYLLLLLHLLELHQLHLVPLLVFRLLLLRLPQFSLFYRQHHYVVIEVKSPLLLALGLRINWTCRQGLGELQDLVFGQSDGEEISLVLSPGWKSQLSDVLQHDSCLGHNVLQFSEVQVLKFLYFGVIVEGAFIDTDDSLGGTDVGIVDLGTFARFPLKPRAQFLNQCLVLFHLNYYYECLFDLKSLIQLIERRFLLSHQTVG